MHRRALTLVEVLVATALATILIGVLSFTFIQSQEIATRVTERMARIQRLRLLEEHLARDLEAIDVQARAPRLRPPGQVYALSLIVATRLAGSDVPVRATVEYALVPGRGVVRRIAQGVHDVVPAGGTPDELLPDATELHVRYARAGEPRANPDGTLDRFKEPSAETFDETQPGSRFVARDVAATLVGLGPRSFALDALARPIPGLVAGATVTVTAGATPPETLRLAGLDGARRPLLESARLQAGPCTVTVATPPVEVEVRATLAGRAGEKLSFVRVFRVGTP